MRTAKVLSVVPNNIGNVICQCENCIENHNKLIIKIDSCPKCNSSLNIEEEKRWTIYDSNIKRHINLKGIFRFFLLEDGLNVMFEKQIHSKKLKLY